MSSNIDLENWKDKEEVSEIKANGLYYYGMYYE
jgi:hypothetical protein